MLPRRVVYVCLVAVIFYNWCTGTDIFVNPTEGLDNQDCLDGGNRNPCKTLLYPLSKVRQNATLHLAPATHKLARNRSASVIVSARTLALVGENSGVGGAIVQCDPGAGLIFNASTAVTIIHVTIRSCGMIQANNADSSVQYRSALSFYYCENITLSHLRITDSNGLGLIVYNAADTVILQSCEFADNAVNSAEVGLFPGGGGVSIILKNDAGATDFYTSSNQFYIANCNFTQNNATLGATAETRLPFYTFTTSSSYGKGGGLAVTLHEDTSNNNVFISSCIFSNNGALYGAGLKVQVEDRAAGNVVHISQCEFISNPCYGDGQSPLGSVGGGASITFIYNFNASGSMNYVQFSDCSFVDNYARMGAGLAVIYSKMMAKSLDRVEIVNCSYMQNWAQVGSAISVSTWSLLPFGYVPMVTINETVFLNNSISSSENATIGMGTVYAEGVPLYFQEAITFSLNNGTALVVSANSVELAPSATLCFSGNIGHAGGALALLNKAWLVVNYYSEVIFIDNHAHVAGGAIFAAHYGYQQPAYTRSCFVRHANELLDPDEWQALFHFENNTYLTSMQENSVYTPSIMSCVWSMQSSNYTIQTDIDRALCWKNWTYQNSNCSAQIRTGISTFQFTTDPSNPLPTYPGKQQLLPIQFFDDKYNNLTLESVVHSQVLDSDSFVQHYISYGHLTACGQPGTNHNLLFSTILPRVVQTRLELNFLLCPPGFVTTHTKNVTGECNYECVCDDDYNHNIICNKDDFVSHLRLGFFMSYNKSSQQCVVFPLRVGLVQANMSTNQTINGFFTLPQETAQLNDKLCNPIGRTGMFCEDCLNGTSAALYSYSYECVNCTDDDVKWNWAAYLTYEFVPTTIFFVFLVFFKISTTTGPANAFILFAQVLTTPIEVTNILNQMSFLLPFKNENHVKTVIGVLLLPYSIWNLDFLSILMHPFCISQNMKAMHVFALNYLTATYPLLLVVCCYICIELHAHNFRPIVWMWRPMGYCLGRCRRNWELRACVIDSFSTFLLLSYTKFCFTTFYLLNPVQPFGPRGNSIGPQRLFFDPSVLYARSEHIPLMLLAIFILIFVILLPPIFLLIFPSKTFQQFISRHRSLQSEPIRRFVEAFQGCYKDGTNGTRDCRYFASVYFAFRISFFATVFIEYDLPKQRVFQVILIGTSLFLFSVIKPYKREVYNILDSFIFTLILIILTIALYNATITNGNWYMNIFLIVPIFVPLLCMTLYVLWTMCTALRRCFQPTYSQIDSNTFYWSGHTDSWSSIPDRIINPDDYNSTENLHQESSPLLHTPPRAQCHTVNSDNNVHYLWRHRANRNTAQF